jgi:hypothetical protein
MSQYPDNEFGRALRAQVEVRHEFYKEYVLDDHGFEMLGCIHRLAAMAMIQNSPYRPLMSRMSLGHRDHMADEGSTPDWLMNKGAVRITPSETFTDILERKEEDKDNWDGFYGFLTEWGHCNQELWVTNLDGRYYMCRPRKEEDEE